MADTTNDEVLLQSGICSRVWQLFQVDPPKFKKEVKEYFELGYPGWTVVKVNYAKRRIYLRDDRHKTGV